MDSAVGPISILEGRPRIMLGSNNYLGLGNHPAITEGARNALCAMGGSTTGTPPLNGTTSLVLTLEEELADWHETEDALVFTSGYQANLGTVAALLGAGDTAILDVEAHASLHDGARLSGAGIRTFPHNDVAALRRQLERVSGRRGLALVVIDGLYSMRGDLAPIDRIAALTKEFGFPLMVDEAHSIGVMGARRTGAVELFGAESDVEIRMGALSKGMGSTGGFIAGRRTLTDALRLHARALLFSTSAAPAALGSSLAAVRLVRSPEGAELASAANANAVRLRNLLLDAGIDVGGISKLPTGEVVVAPNLSIVIGDDVRTIRAWRYAFENGVFCAAALQPAVASDGGLLRLSVMATHTESQLQQAAEIVADAVQNHGISRATERSEQTVA
ncbi:aminotransferase class I/II-fold pyridoxal phosphate-dependent enzyme [Aldersonia sp. NBC_00410]|uniref:aminotransferase class I/II-fold pyridoxal phosphate-dependent enzyme n=1 Tax=Aldersonia sp. NBC_00410 TaxID=2975954 RepID=UPI0022592275|nr:aminotransferase class I/II-fold pyridoxal phosphate-dependent enzyme [Aldersonia sp. NBC_00410]MCX5041643.1 aminotransferase class I/II-fold pyridoxal phosphate-dependent enzyme [Aldersonia sp. NBC_00410]